MRFSSLPIAELDPQLGTRWRELRAQSEDLVSPFFTPAFAQAVGRCRDDLFLGVIEDESGIRGLLPFHRCKGGRGVPVGGQVCDYQGVIGTAPPASALSDMLLGFDLTSFDFNHGLSSQALLSGNAFSTSTSRRADLRQGYAHWLDEVSQHTSALKTLARKERKLIREVGPLRFEINDETPAAWDQFQRWKADALKQKGVRFLSDGWDKRLLEKLRQERGPDLTGRLSTLYAGKIMVAAHFGICTPQAWHWWFPTYDPDMGNLSAGLILMRHCIAAAADEGIIEFDFGRGNERYKTEFANGSRALCEGSLENAATRAGAMRRFSKFAQRRGDAWLPARHAELMNRVARKLLKAGRL